MKIQNKIASLTFSVQVDDAERAFAIRQYLHRDWQSTLQPIVDQSLQTIDHEQRWHHLDKLEIKLQLQDIHQLEEKLFQSLTEQLAAKLGGDETLQPPNRVEISQALTSINLADQAGSDVSSQALSTPNSQWSELDIIAHYLVSGRRPWFVNSDEFLAIFDHVVQSDLSNLVRHTDALGTVSGWLRLVDFLQSQTGSDWQSIVLAQISSSTDSLMPIYSELLRRLSQSAGAANTIAYQPVVAIVSLLTFIQPSLARDQTASSVVNLIPQTGVGWSKLLSVCPQWRREEQLLIRRFKPPAIALVSMQEAGGGSNAVLAQFSDEDSTETDELPTGSAPLKSMAESSGSGAEIEDEHQNQIQESDASVLLDNAGLVLLRPFIGRLFDHCGITVEQGRINNEHLPRAAALLYTAAHGARVCHEYDLGIIKVLLGVTLETPIPVPDKQLSNAELAQVSELLLAVINHWDALGKTSIDGLRQSFLTRAGILHEKDNYFDLNFERLGHDVLLERLPWSITTVTFPWMHKPINVNW